MTEPLSDKTLAENQEALRQYDESHACYTFELADAVRDLLAEVARLKARENDLIGDTKELKDQIDRRDFGSKTLLKAIESAQDSNAEFARRNGELETENATLREDNARLEAALEAQGVADFLAAFKAKAMTCQDESDEDEGAAYCIDFDFDAEGDPPKVMIYDVEDGLAAMEIFEDPTCRHPSGWSWESEDWEPGPLAKEVLDMLNGEPEEEDGDE